MNIFATPEFKVGLLVLIVAGIIAGMSLRVTQDPGFLGTSKIAWFYIDDASGLVKNSGVRMAGINVGVIRDIKLENGEARVDMVLQGDIPLTKSARIEIRPNGILGDKNIEIISGDPRDPQMRSGEQILVVDDRASMDRLLSEVSKITKSLSSIAENIKTGLEGDADKPLGRIIHNIETLSGDLAEVTHGKRAQIAEIVDNIHSMSETLNTLVNDDSDEGLKASVKDALRGLRRLDSTMKNVDEISAKINKGEGTIGKLINDEKTVDNINTAVEGINGFLSTGEKIQTSIDYHTHYLSRTANAKSYLSVNIQPGLDRYYEVGIVDDPGGVSERTVTKDDVGGATYTTTEDKRYFQRVKFNALFAKNFYNFTLKGGIIENTGGFAADFFTLRHRLRFSLEAFDFQNFNLRASARYTMFHGLYLTGGGEDIAKKPSGFVGGGLFLTNDDLKLLLTKVAP
jgi:phospholipid/cholesterol/gamma-HCH transport system substrate-binding protein